MAVQLIMYDSIYVLGVYISMMTASMVTKITGRKLPTNCKVI